MVDWNQVAGLAGKAFSLFKGWTDTLSQEREIFIPEGMINTALTAMLGKDGLVRSLLVECRDGGLDIDALVMHEGNEIQIRAAFELQSITVNRHKQTVALRESREPELLLKRWASTTGKWKLLLRLWACRRLLRQHPLHYALRKLEGFEINQGVYRIDLSTYVRQRAALVAALYAVDVRNAALRPGGVVLRGSANVKSLDTLRSLYQMAAGTVTQVRDELERPAPRTVFPDASDDE